MARRDLSLGTDIAQCRAVADNKLTLFNDAAAGPTGGGAFAEVLKVIENAAMFVFISDWSFQPLAILDPRMDPVGKLLLKKARAAHGNFLMAIHVWNHTRVGAKDVENDNGEYVLQDLALRQWPPNLLWRSSVRGGIGWALHQKYVVADAPTKNGRRTITAFCGGLDLTRGRYDWPDHPNLPDQENQNLKWMLDKKR